MFSFFIARKVSVVMKCSRAVFFFVNMRITVCTYPIFYMMTPLTITWCPAPKFVSSAAPQNFWFETAKPEKSAICCEVQQSHICYFLCSKFCSIVAFADNRKIKVELAKAFFEWSKFWSKLKIKDHRIYKMELSLILQDRRSCPIVHCCQAPKCNCSMFPLWRYAQMKIGACSLKYMFETVTCVASRAALFCDCWHNSQQHH